MVVPAVRPSLAKAVPPIVRFWAVPVLRTILPPLIDEAVVVPVTASMADKRCATLSPIPILVPALTEPATKVKVTPSTVSVSPVVMPVERSFEVELPVPDSRVAPEIAAAVSGQLLVHRDQPLLGDRLADRSRQRLARAIECVLGRRPIVEIPAVQSLDHAVHRPEQDRPLPEQIRGDLGFQSRLERVRRAQRD